MKINPSSFLQYIFLSCLVVFISCNANKKTTTSANESKEITKLKTRIQENKIEFSTFYGKGKVVYDDGKTKIAGNLKLKVKNNDKIWVSATKFGFEGARILITQDSLFYVNRLKKTYIKAPIKYLEEKFKIPANFSDVQNYLIGNIIYKENSTFDIQSDLIQIITLLDENKLTYTINPQDLSVSNVTAVDATDRKVNSLFTEYVKDPIGLFSTKRKIEAIEPNKVIKAEITYSKRTWNEKLDMPFSIPSNYKQQKI